MKWLLRNIEFSLFMVISQCVYSVVPIIDHKDIIQEIVSHEYEEVPGQGTLAFAALHGDSLGAFNYVNANSI